MKLWVFFIFAVLRVCLFERMIEVCRSCVKAKLVACGQKQIIAHLPLLSCQLTKNCYNSYLTPSFSGVEYLSGRSSRVNTSKMKAGLTNVFTHHSLFNGCQILSVHKSCRNVRTPTTMPVKCGLDTSLVHVISG